MTIAPEARYGSVAADYLRARPTYPPELFKWLATLAPDNRVALDCACGCGEASVGVAPYFEKVIAIDISRDLIERAVPIENVQYRVAPAESTGLEDSSVDLITVGMAVHWFDLSAFRAEALRVLKPEGVLCAWSYGEPYTDDASMNTILRHYADLIHPYGPPNLRHVWDGYRNLALFSDDYSGTDSPRFTMRAECTLEQLITYYRTRSSVRAFADANGFHPADDLANDLAPLWGRSQETRRIYRPMAVKTGRKNGAIAALDKELTALLSTPSEPQRIQQAFVLGK